ncbi:dipeptidase [Paenibacillus periandrae]|uniref:dipeptidase n=1 Tax=Paenibacillus periandrae TaxID=1761741 RepID=UPI001F09DAA6|nr:membrane dipeptidase [Paenibacillus periandrae]
MKKKAYDGYTSFSYLEESMDYQNVPLSSQEPTKASYTFHLNSKEETRVQRIFDKHVIVSMRDHGFMMPARFDDIDDYCRNGYTAFAYEGLAKSGLDVVFDNFMDGIMNITSKMGLKWDDVIYNLGLRYCDLAHQDTAIVARTLTDIINANENGQVAVVPCLEAATALENEIDRVDILYGLGIRCMGITYNEANTLGSGLAEDKDGGLTQFGRRVVKRMNQLGMAIDISHCGDATSLDVIEASDKPVLITHAGARALWNTPRMKSDEILLACKAKGGIIGILAAPNTTLTKEHEGHSLDSVMAHFEYIRELVGINHIGFGPDTFYGDHVALQHAVDQRLTIGKSHSGETFDEAPFVLGVENPTEAMPNIVKWLVQHGYSSKDIAKAAGGNVMRVLHDIWVK